MRTLLLLVGALALSGCGGALISAKQETELGRGVHTEIKKQYRLLDPSDPVSKWAVELVRPLQSASARFRNPGEFGGYKVAVIHDPKLVNAFAAPGGYTYLSTGLILTAANCAEIAGVMGHELAHVTQRHGVKTLEQQVAASTIAGWFFGDSVATEATVMTLNILQGTKFSREHETESDTVGLQIAHDAGYNPYGLAAFFSKLLREEKKRGGAPPEFLSSHPATDRRVRAVKAQIQRRYGKVETKNAKRDACQKTRLQLDAVQRRIRAGSLKFASGGGGKKGGVSTGKKKTGGVSTGKKKQ